MKDAAQKARIESMKRELERRGGFVGPMAGMPDDVIELFLREILDCPDCAGEEHGLDDLYDPFIPRRRQAHDH